MTEAENMTTTPLICCVLALVVALLVIALYGLGAALLLSILVGAGFYAGYRYLRS